MIGLIDYTALVDGRVVLGQVDTGKVDLYGELLSMFIKADIKKKCPKAFRIRITSL